MGVEQFLFGEETIREQGEHLSRVLSGVHHDDIIFTDSTGSVPLPHYLTRLLHEQGHEMLAQLQDGDVFPFKVDLRQNVGLSMSVKGERLPGPKALDVVGKLRRITETVHEQRFQLGDIHISTSAMNLRGVAEQVSLVWVPQPDGTSQLVLSRGPVTPRKVRKRVGPSAR